MIAWTDVVDGPANYQAGGFTIATSLSTIDSVRVTVAGRGPNLPVFHARVVRNSPSAGSFKVLVMEHQYDKTNAVGSSLTGLPSGVAGRSTSGGEYDADAAHVHSIAHDHAAKVSAGVAGAAGGSQINAVGPIQIRTHDHSFDTPNLAGNSGAGQSHTHVWNSLYQHQQQLTNTQTDIATTELANGTDISGTTFCVLAMGS